MHISSNNQKKAKNDDGDDDNPCFVIIKKNLGKVHKKHQNNKINDCLQFVRMEIYPSLDSHKKSTNYQWQS